jgi:hypothetical protein
MGAGTGIEPGIEPGPTVQQADALPSELRRTLSELRRTLVATSIKAFTFFILQ